MNNLEHIKSQIKPILKKYGIKKAGIFGSSARGESVINDLDLLVKIDKKFSLLEFIGIQQELEDELGMKVDLVEYDAIKPALKDEILRDEESVLCAKENLTSIFRTFWKVSAIFSVSCRRVWGSGFWKVGSLAAQSPNRYALLCPNKKIK